MEVMKKRVKVGHDKVYDMEMLYARLLTVLQSRHVDLSELFKYELSPVPSSLFDEYGDMRKGSLTNWQCSQMIPWKQLMQNWLMAMKLFTTNCGLKI